MIRETNRNWIERTPLVSVSSDITIMQRLLANRNMVSAQDAEEFMKSEGPLHDPFGLTGMEEAVNRLCRAIRSDERIAVYGDYDVDGVTATALLVQVLRRLGGNADAYIPNRFEEGYGLNRAALDDLAQKGFQLVVTVDCGIRSPREAEHARQLGLD